VGGIGMERKGWEKIVRKGGGGNGKGGRDQKYDKKYVISNILNKCNVPM
jgi:hypothetical protein